MPVYETLTDYITGKDLPNVGAEENRQAFARFLVEEKGYSKEDIEINAPITIEIDGAPYLSRMDLIVAIDEKRLIAVKCAAGSLESRVREILGAARITGPVQIPFSLVTDGKTAIFLDTISGKKIGEGLSAVPDRKSLAEMAENLSFLAFPREKRAKEDRIFYSYDSMNVNR